MCGPPDGAQSGPSPVDRARPGSKHHLIVDGQGIPLAVSLTGGNRNDITQLLPLLDKIPAWLRANEERLRLQQTWHRFFVDGQYDVLITPAAPTAAIPAGSRSLTVDGVERSFFDQTGWANLTSHVGLPSLVMPIAHGADGLPIGVQLVGPAYSDRTLLVMAEHLAPLLGGTAEGVIAPWSR